MFWFIVSLVSYAVFTFTLMYCMFGPQIFNVDVEENTYLPKLSDINDDFFDWNIADKYTTKVIGPAYNYFDLRGELKGAADDGKGCAAIAFIQPLSYLFIVINVKNIFPNNGMNEFWYKIIVQLSCLAFCAICCVVLYFVYSKTLAVKDFDYKQCVSSFVYDESEFHVSKRTAFINHTIYHHHYYLRCVASTTQKRGYLLSPLIVFALAFYILSFMIVLGKI